MSNSDIRAQIWYAMLDSQLSTRYWFALAQQYHTVQTLLNFVLLAFSSFTVASWFLVGNMEILWKVFSVLTFIVSLWQAVIGIPRKISDMESLSKKWNNIFNQYEDLYLNISNMGENELREEFNRIRKLERKNDVSTVHLNYDKSKLKSKLRNQIIKERGL